MKTRDYLIVATEAGYSVYIDTGEKRFPLGDRPYPSLSRARDQIPKRFRNRARLVHKTAYTELVNTAPQGSPAMDLPVFGQQRRSDREH